MPNTSPAGDSVAWPNVLVPCDASRQHSSLRLHHAGTARGSARAVKTLAETRRLRLTDDGSYVANDALMCAAMREAKTLNRTIFDHAVVLMLAKDGVIRDCPAARTLGLPIFPAEAEVEAVRRDIALCREQAAGSSSSTSRPQAPLP